MKTYTELTAEQQKAAIDKELAELLGAVVTGALRFNDGANGDDIQARIDQALTEAERVRTPWFAHEYVMDCPAVAEVMRGIATATCEDALYLTCDDPVVIEGIA